METKGLEQMTKEELIGMVGSLDKELKDATVSLNLYKGMFSDEREKTILLQDKINAFKHLAKVI